MKCTCGRDLIYPAMLMGVDKNAVAWVQFGCACGHQLLMPHTTMKPYTFKRSAGFPPKPGEWWAKPEGGHMVCCPLCKGMPGVRAPEHTVDAKGAVFPSYVCPSGCGFHAYITLGGYGEAK